MPITRDTPLEWDAIPDPPAPVQYQPRPRPETHRPALTERDRVELDTLRSNRDHYKTLAILLKDQLDAAQKQLAKCTCHATHGRPTKPRK